MIDRDARKRLGRLMRNFATGKLTNHDFDRAFDHIHSTDQGVDTIGMATSLSYDDSAALRLRGKHRQTKETRRAMARCLLFLQTDAEYAESPLPWRERVRGLLSGLTCGLVPKSARLREWEWHERNVWPFLTPEQLQEALRHPKLLCRRAA